MMPTKTRKMFLLKSLAMEKKLIQYFSKIDIPDELGFLSYGRGIHTHLLYQF